MHDPSLEKDPVLLLKRVQETKARLQELRFKCSSAQWKQVREIRTLKRTIARMYTLLSQSAANPEHKAE